MLLVSLRSLLAARGVSLLPCMTSDAAVMRWARCAASSGGSGGDGRGAARGKAAAREQAARYLKKKECTAVAAGRSGPHADSAPRSRLAEAAAEFSEAQQAWMLSSPSGLGVGAEAAITQAIQEGALDDLPGKGKPLPALDHSAQFGSADPLVAALTRTMGAQGVKPLSLELQEEVQRDLSALRRQLEVELRRALAAGAAAEPQPRSSSGSGSSWFTRLLGGGGQGGAADSGSSSSSSRRQPTVKQIRSGRHPPLQHAAAEVNRLIRQYNHAVLADREAFGSGWPLDRMRQLDWAAEVDAALQALGSSSTSSTSS